MSTKFQLNGVNPKDFVTQPVKKQISKKPTSILNPGKIDHTNGRGVSIRTLERGNMKDMDGNPYERSTGNQCWWHRFPFDGLAMGIPVKIVGEDLYMDGVFCCYSCAYAYLIEDQKKLPQHRNINYTNSCTLLKRLFSQEFPGDILEPADDWRLIKTVGNGTIHIKEFTQGLKGFRIIPNPLYKFVPVVATYSLITKP